MVTASILLETDAPPDHVLIGAVLARRLGYAQTDGKLAALRARGLLLGNVPLDRAAVIVQDLRRMGVPCYCVRDEIMPTLPPPRRIVTAEWTPDILRYKARGKMEFDSIPWSEVETIAVCLVRSEQRKGVIEKFLLPNLPTIYAIDDEEAKKHLREKLATIFAKRAEAATQAYALNRTNLEEKTDLVVAKLLEKGETEGLIGYMDLLVGGGEAEVRRSLRLRVVSTEFMFTGLGSAIKGTTMENFRALVKEFSEKATTAKKTGTIGYLLGPSGSVVKATFDTLRQFDSYLRWFLQINRLGSHPEEFLTGPVAGQEPALPDIVAGQLADGSGTTSAAALPGTLEASVRWHILDYVLVPLSTLGILPLLEVIRRVASGRIDGETVLWGIRAPVGAVVALVAVCATIGTVLWTLGHGPSWLKRGILAVLVAVSAALVAWMMGIDRIEDEMIRQMIAAFIEDRQATYKPPAVEGSPQTMEEVLDAYLHPNHTFKITALDRSGTDAYATVVVEQRFPLRFYLLKADQEWLVMRIWRSREEIKIDNKTGVRKKKMVLDELYSR